MNAIYARCFSLGTFAALGDGMFLLLALADIDNGFALCGKVGLTVLCEWVGYF